MCSCWAVGALGSLRLGVGAAQSPTEGPCSKPRSDVDVKGLGAQGGHPSLVLGMRWGRVCGGPWGAQAEAGEAREPPAREELADGGDTVQPTTRARLSGEQGTVCCEVGKQGPDGSRWVARPRGPSKCELDLSCGCALSSHPGLAQQGPVDCGPSCPSGTRGSGHL